MSDDELVSPTMVNLTSHNFAKNFYKITVKHLSGVLFLIKVQTENFSRFTRKHLCWSLAFNKV